MGDSKSPATKIAAGFLVHEMLEQGEKHFLHDFFSILNAQSGSEQITKEAITPRVEQTRDFLFKAPGVDRASTGLSR